MSAYLIIDVDDLLAYLDSQTFAPNMMDVAVSLRNTAALAVGLVDSNQLIAIAVANWNQHHRAGGTNINVQQVFVSAGYDLFNVTERRFLADALLTDYFPLDTETSISEMIIASSQPELMELVNRLKLPPTVRVRVWADEQPSGQNVIFQPLESILGVKTKSVALYIDFENIAISLNEQGYIVDLDVLISALKNRTAHYGQVIHIAAYAPWGQRGSLPPMLDAHGREISDDVPSRLAVENIDPVFSLPGKNSADLRIAKDVLAESTAPNSPEIIIIASGDRDFNDIYNTLRARGKQVIVWGVRGSTSRVLENNTSIRLEYVDDFALFRRHKELIYDDRVSAEDEEIEFRPSQWSSLVIQYDYLKAIRPDKKITVKTLAEQLDSQNTTTNVDRATELVEQALQIGILQDTGDKGRLELRPSHPVVVNTRLIRDHIVNRVSNTLAVRQWDYVNYGFLLKGIAMDEKLSTPGINLDDNWRSEWIDFLVRERVLERELIPHRHNPDDLVPVIRVPDEAPDLSNPEPDAPLSDDLIVDMGYRVIISVEQFTSFRKFIWCPLGSLHKRLRPFDESTAFQRAVEYLQEEGAILVQEYSNPQSDFLTKGVSLQLDSPMVQRILAERNTLIKCLIKMYEERRPISVDAIQAEMGFTRPQTDLWISIMELENVLNPQPNQPGVYSLFRMHHTVSIVAEAESV